MQSLRQPFYLLIFRTQISEMFWGVGGRKLLAVVVEC